MDKITTCPIDENASKDNITNLKNILLFLLDKGFLGLGNNEQLIQNFKNEAKENISFYGGKTRDLIMVLQKKNTLAKKDGIVDSSTANFLNNLLDQAQSQPAPPSVEPLPPANKDEKPNPQPETANKEEKPCSPERCVYGEVRDEYTQLLSDVIVQAFDQGMRDEKPLGKSIATKKDGYYEIRYDPFQCLKKDRGQANLLLKVLSATGEELYKTPVLYNAPNEVEINIVLQGVEYKGPSEFEALNETLMSFLEDKVKPSDLREDDQFQDISFLSQESGFNPLVIGMWFLCCRLSDKMIAKNILLEPAVFFGFMRQGQPMLLTDSLLVDIKNPNRFVELEEKTLRALADMSSEHQQLVLEKALGNNIIPARITSQVKNILATLRQIKISFAADINVGVGAGTIGQLLALNPVASARADDFIRSYIDYTGPLDDTFWQKLETDKVLDPEIVKQTKLIFDLGRLALSHIPLVSELNNRFLQGKLKSKSELAKYSIDDWKLILKSNGVDGKPINVPDNIEGKDNEEKITKFSTILEQQFENAYPTTSFAAKLAKTEATPIKTKTDIVVFMENNPDFQLDSHRIDHYLAENKNALKGVTDKDTMLKELNSIQRAFKLSSNYKVVDTLLTNNLNSAQKIYFMGVEQFTEMMNTSSIKLDKADAQIIYRKAENAYSQALGFFTIHNKALAGIMPFSIPSVKLDPKTQSTIDTLPNLQTLFGSLDYCTCSDCRSVYSLPSYFVDILAFLGNRKTLTGQDVKSLLLKRRPDLGEIELSCKNTNTILPYIDLVNELLEDAVCPPIPLSLNGITEADLIPGKIQPQASLLNKFNKNNIFLGEGAVLYEPDIKGQWMVRDQQNAYKITKIPQITGGVSGVTLQLLRTRQTFLSADELRANPEYTNQGAYDQLKTETFPLNLPFDLWTLEARTYLDHLGVPQPKLFELFQHVSDQVTPLIQSPTDVQIDCAWLNMTDAERKILLTGGMLQDDTWGLPPGLPPGIAGGAIGSNINTTILNPDDPTQDIVARNWVEALSYVNVMLNRSGLTYQELLQLLDMKFVNPNSTMQIYDISQGVNAGNTTPTVSCNIANFRIDHMSPYEAAQINRFIRLWRKVGCSMCELDLILSSFPDKKITDYVLQVISKMSRLKTQLKLDWRTLYSFYNDIDNAIYLDHGQDGAPPIQTLYQRLFCNKLVNAVALFPENPDKISGPIQGNTEITGSAASAFENKDKIPAMLSAFSINEADLKLIFENLNITGKNNLDLKILSQIYRIIVLTQALNLTIDGFLRLKRLFGQDPFADPKNTLSFIKLAEKISTSAFSIMELDYLLTHHYSMDSNVTLDDNTVIATIIALRDGLQKINDSIELKSGQTPENYVKSKLGSLPSLGKDSDALQAITIIDNTWQGVPAERSGLIKKYFSDLVSLSPDIEAQLGALPSGGTTVANDMSVKARFEYIQKALQAYLLQSQKKGFILQKTAEAFQLDVSAVDKLLSSLQLTNSSNSTPSPTLLKIIDDSNLLKKNAIANDYSLSIDETNFPNIFNAFRLLHKNALLINKLKIKAEELVWWLQETHATDMGWMHPKDFPLSVTPTALAVPIAKWESINDFFHWKNNFFNANAASTSSPSLTVFGFLDQALSIPVPTTLLDTVAQSTGWDRADLQTLLSKFQWDVKKAFTNQLNLNRLTNCIQTLNRLGVNAERAIAWATPQPSAQDAETLKQTVKAKYDLTQWQSVIQPLQDVFREQKRVALTSWLVMHPDKNKKWNWSDLNGLYSYFLIDVEMCACMLTSRLKQATASVQLFVQRCLMNLETGVEVNTANDSKWNQWQWMKHYNLWEANREVFLYPENWIEPELRDNKTPFFKDLENELMQSDITDDTVEQAYLNYLEKLDTVANLEIRAIYDEFPEQDSETNKQNKTLHIFGRTRSSHSPEYYYRQRRKGVLWMPWEKIGLDINGDHLMVGMLNRRLHLFWPQFLTKTEKPTNTKIPSSAEQKNGAAPLQHPISYWEIRLFWSELKSNKWTPKILSNSFAVVYQDAFGNVSDQSDTLQWFIGKYFTGGNYSQNVHFHVSLSESNTSIETKIFSGRPSTDDPIVSHLAPMSALKFEKIGKQVNLDALNPSEVKYLIAPFNSQYANNLIMHTDSRYFFYFCVDSGSPGVTTPSKNAPLIELLSNISPYSTYSVTNSSVKQFEEEGSFSMWDSNRSYMVDYVLASPSIGFLSNVFRTGTFNFSIHYHPFVELFVKELNAFGIPGLLNRAIQVNPKSISSTPPITSFDFSKNYQPTPLVSPNYPLEDVDFTSSGAYSLYNWELFFHVPFFIANKLSTNQKFESALKWFHYIFNPTSADTPPPTIPPTPQQKYWITKPFYESLTPTYQAQQIENLLLGVAKHNAELENQIEAWREDPFNPHLIARFRTVAYQKNVLIKYIQTLIAWGDQLFANYTIENVNQATQLYILADSVLGKRPRNISSNKTENPVKTFYQLEKDGQGVDDFGNVLEQVENLLGPTSTRRVRDYHTELPRLNILYFCIPNNKQLLTLWDTVADRLFKIRHCMNIEGIVSQLPLFDPLINPALLVQGAASGLDINSLISDINAPMPLYRFTFMLQKAVELCNEVKSLGSALLSAIEKKDAEALALLRSNHELAMIDMVKIIKEDQVSEALNTLNSLNESRNVTTTKQSYYQGLIKDGWSNGEKIAFSLSTSSTALDAAIALGYTISGGLKLVPAFLAGAAGFGGTPTVSATMGGQQIGDGAEMAVRVLQSYAAAFDKGAALASTAAGYERRATEWQFQVDLATAELAQIADQITAADFRHQIAVQESANHDKQKDNMQSEHDYMASKFTNRDLYDWMISKISAVYFQSYKLAYDVAKRVERCFRYELGLADSNYIQFGYWDSLKKGLLAGEKLAFDLKQLEMAYYEQNRREYELTKPISLAQLDPVALLQLRQNGECVFNIPESIFDMDYPGHYFRRIKAVSFSIPCVAGPYTTVACTLTLTNNQLRKDTTLLNNQYERDIKSSDLRFRDCIAAVQSIATSSAQNDHGMFELNFRDERYLPFEGAGAISQWLVQLNKGFKQFDFNTISDVIIHLNYTAREGGQAFRETAASSLKEALKSQISLINSNGSKQSILSRVFDLKREFSDRWYQFLHPANPLDDQAMVLKDLKDRLPFFIQSYTQKVYRIEVAALIKDAHTQDMNVQPNDYQVVLSPLFLNPDSGKTPQLLPLIPPLKDSPIYRGLYSLSKDLPTPSEFSDWVLKIKSKAAADFKSLPVDVIQELFLIVHYKIES